MTAYEKSLSC